MEKIINKDINYYSFLKYLWVTFPDGSEKRLIDVAGENKRKNNVI